MYAILVVWENGDLEYLKEDRNIALFESLDQAKAQKDFMIQGMADEVQSINVIPGLRLLEENAKLRAEFQAFVREWSERFGFLAIKNPRNSIESIDEVARILSREIDRARANSRITFGPTTQHEFQGRADRDCELCGKPDRHPNHNPEGKFNG